jgi:type I restriction enzyme, S subunit
MAEVKSGYKRTEVGVIPEAWEVKQLGTCLLHAPQYGINAPAVQYADNFPIYIRITDITEDGRFSPEKLVSVDHPAAGNYFLNEGDLVFARTGASVGKSYLYDHADGRLVYAGFLIRVRVDESKLVPSYLAHYIKTERYWNWVKMMSMRSGQPGINGNEYAQLPIPLPPTIEEQRAIAVALNEVDEQIAALDDLILKKRNLKKAAMQRLLTGEERLPSFGGEWEVKNIGAEIDLLTGFPFPSNQYASSGVKLLRGSNIKRGYTDWADDLTQYWEEITPDLARYSLEEGDLIIAMDGSLVGKSYARLTGRDTPALLLQRVARIRSKKLDLGFLKEFIGSDYFIKYCDSVKTVTAIPHISPDDIRRFEIPLPPTIEEQQAIAAILSDMDEEITVVEEKREKIVALKQGMMQELLTGKTRLI